MGSNSVSCGLWSSSADPDRLVQMLRIAELLNYKLIVSLIVSLARGSELGVTTFGVSGFGVSVGVAYVGVEVNIH